MPRQPTFVPLRQPVHVAVLLVIQVFLSSVVYCYQEGNVFAAAFIPAAIRPIFHDVYDRVGRHKICSYAAGALRAGKDTAVNGFTAAASDDEEDGTNGIVDEDEVPLLFDDDILHELDYTTERRKAKSQLIHDEDSCCVLPRGIPDGFYVIEQHAIPPEGFDMSAARHILGDCQIERVGLKGDNVTLPAALMMLDAQKYPSLSQARKALRKGYILLHRGLLVVDSSGQRTIFDASKCIRARVKDRVYPNDVVCEQARMGNAFYPTEDGVKAPFELPVVFEDSHFAIVNKPAGVNVNAHRKSGTGRMCVRAAAPYVLKPPAFGTVAIIRRPSPVHRLDKPTSGLLLIAKTKPAMVDLTRQFKERNIRKTYTAIVNGDPKECDEHTITSKEAHDLGCIDDRDAGEGMRWQLIDEPLEDNNKRMKSAVTVWRSRRQVDCPEAVDGVLTLVELKPKTGRYHQLRRHMAWVCKRPLVGDRSYSGNIEMSKQFLDHGLYLCSNKVSLLHPYYNTEEGRKQWEALDTEDKYRGGMICLSDDGSNKVLVHAEIEVPQYFQDLLDTRTSSASDV